MDIGEDVDVKNAKNSKKKRTKEIERKMTIYPILVPGLVCKTNVMRVRVS